MTQALVGLLGVLAWRLGARPTPDRADTPASETRCLVVGVPVRVCVCVCVECKKQCERKHRYEYK